MHKLMLMAGVAALAASAPALAQGNGNGNGGGNQGGGPAKAEKMDRGGQKGPDKAKGPEKRAEMGPDKQRGNPGKGPDRADRPQDIEKAERQVFRNNDRRDAVRRDDSPANRDVVRVASRQWQDGRYRYDDSRYLIPVSANCPPGLAKKNNGCLPPGQAKKLAVSRSWGDWYPVRYLGNDYDWRYGNGYIYRVGNGGLVSGLVPLLGGALFGGQVWPTQYTDYAVPTYYDRYYGFDDGYDYRYAQNAIFEVNPQSNLIEGIAALLTGDTWAVGQPMPAGYDFYNVPPTWRDRYADTPDSMYRYSDGYVYEVDPTTQLVRAVIELIA
ncbi:hypothetical protein [Novosphingobium taihuense]|uniref:Nickel/cobalt transporter regulator n=1 Tax=Novosphingobium taihuense TaxID=260085 RepID=A0A7W7A9R2_9SPHN|nr:hypothetical protein [Novosphingobium taihuense]MBB4612832.1 hypothetical protein [Novosphingobium taihuense]TWH80258.1 hypothetical protein IQ25_03718 [Novosphingobium taihuense]